MPRVPFTDAAQADLADALAWYEAQAAEIIAQFRQALASPSFAERRDAD